MRIETGRLLAQHQYHVVCANDGLDAVQQIEAQRPDMVITDVEMPGIGGFELTRQLRANPRARCGAFLGINGAVYRLLRQYGTVVYFGFTCLCMLIAGAAIERSAQATARPLPRLLQHAPTALAVGLVLLGLVDALAGLWLDGEGQGAAFGHGRKTLCP